MSSLQNKLFSLFCVSTLIGVWPRFIEPNLLSSTNLRMKLKGLQRPFQLVQLSDLHVGAHTCPEFLKRIQKQVAALDPDLIVLTGDFLCYGKMAEKERLVSFFQGLHAKWGVYAILGNHDYAGGITVNRNGDYDVSRVDSTVVKGVQLLFKKQHLSGRITPEVHALQPEPSLLALLKQSGIILLNNRTEKPGGLINLTGVEEYMAGRVDLKKAYEQYDPALPGILLAHNPDAVPMLLQTPSECILSGHTHGGQVNLPWFRDRFTLMEHPRYFSGFIQEAGKKIYISRGLGSVMPFRFFARPEIVSIQFVPEVS